MEISEIDGVHGLRRDSISLANDLQQVLHDVGRRRIRNEIKHNYTQMYFHRFIEQVNKQKKKNRKQRMA